jgi:thiol:disulfide interchange protein
MTAIRFLTLAAVIAFPLAIAQAADAPRIADPKIEAAQHPYDEVIDGHAELAAAIAQAKASNKILLIDFGANWCPDCRALGGVTERADVKPWLQSHYVEVAVDVGRWNKNLDIAESYGLKLKELGIPAVVVATPDGKVLNAKEVGALGDARTMTPQAVVDVLARWCAAPVQPAS